MHIVMGEAAAPPPPGGAAHPHHNHQQQLPHAQGVGAAVAHAHAPEDHEILMVDQDDKEDEDDDVVDVDEGFDLDEDEDVGDDDIIAGGGEERRMAHRRRFDEVSDDEDERRHSHHRGDNVDGGDVMAMDDGEGEGDAGGHYQHQQADGRNPNPGAAEDRQAAQHQHNHQQQQQRAGDNGERHHRDNGEQQQHPAAPQAAQAQAQAQDPPQAQQQQQQQQQEAADDPGLDGYDRTDLIGQGAYGVVFKGTQRSSGDVVAIKRIPFGDANLEGGVPCAVIREISLLRELDHENVVRLLDVIQAQPGGLYLVFEFVAHDLKTYMDSIQATDDPMQRRGLPMEKVRSFMLQILRGVGFCHTYRVLHRDLKPHNLLISSDGNQLKLADFGLARLSALPNGPYTHEVVTLWYRAPELLLGANRYSAAVDVWSIGCIFAEMVTGYALFPGRSDIDQLFKIFQRRGTPTQQSWPNYHKMPHYNPEFPMWAPRPITDFVGMEALGSEAAADLLEKILRYDPDSRIGCKAGLNHPYFYEGPGGHNQQG